ncbi:MAG: hypothetical protein WCK70_04640 [Chloroflexales bacterium]|jgi:hypothetical protein
MEEDFRRRLIKGALNLVFSLAASWLATYITNKILGEPEETKQLS